MAESFTIPVNASKEERYKSLLPQVNALLEGEPDLIANLANLAAALKFGMGFFWVGFYLVKNKGSQQELVLGPFQGPVACTRIAKGRGVCGKSWESKEVIIVEDVEKFPGHIACSSESKSEIVLPAFDSKGEVFLVLDVDSDKLADFDQSDKKYLSELMRTIEKLNGL
jgi:L-methionine (R)-S-oxide reductase